MRPKKILLLSSYGGYGHIAAANTLKSLLGDQYEIETFYPIKEMRIFGITSGESIYNFLISHNLIRLTNWIVRHFVNWIFLTRGKSTTRLIEGHIKKIEPDIVISLIPFINFPASEAARRYDIPFLLVTTDNNLHNWCFDLHKRRHENFRVTIGSNLPTSKNTLIKKLVPEHVIETIGLPLRPGFLQTKSKEQLRKIYDIPQEKDVVLIMMGGMGSRSTLQYVKTIMRHPLDVHLLVCTGKNQKLAKKLKEIIPAKGNSIDIIPFTEKIHEIFALSDLVITKPGPGTVNEALALKLPALIDCMGVPLFWEKVNIDLVQNQNVGACIRSLKDLPNSINLFLRDEQTREKVVRGYEELAENQFADRIHPIIEEMIGVVSPGEVLLTSRNITPSL